MCTGINSAVGRSVRPAGRADDVFRGRLREIQGRTTALSWAEMGALSRWQYRTEDHVDRDCFGDNVTCDPLDGRRIKTERAADGRVQQGDSMSNRLAGRVRLVGESFMDGYRRKYASKAARLLARDVVKEVGVWTSRAAEHHSLRTGPPASRVA